MSYIEDGFKRERRCCFVGYTPEKLNRPPVLMRTKLREAIQREITEGHTTFVCGLNRGIELWSADIVLNERKDDDRVKLICIDPENCGTDEEWRQSCIKIMESADLVRSLRYKDISGRNRWMLDRCANLIAVYNGSKDSTKQAIDYAVRSRVNVRIL